jgi:hypothetical protein
MLLVFLIILSESTQRRTRKLALLFCIHKVQVSDVVLHAGHVDFCLKASAKVWRFLFSKVSRPVMGPPNLQFNGKPGILPRLKWRLCHECNHPPEFSAYLKMSRAVPPIRRAPSWRLQGQIYFYLRSLENFLDSA